MNRREIYRNEWMGILEFDVIRPDGGKGIYAYMNCHPAIGIVPVNDEGITWLVGQYRFPVEKFLWEIPSGMGEKNESNRETALRELREETGLTGGEILELGSFYTSNSLTDETATIFLARNLSPGKTDFDVTEKLTIKKVHISEAMEMIDEGLIRDSMSLIGLRWAVEYLKKLFHNLP